MMCAVVVSIIPFSSFSVLSFVPLLCCSVSIFSDSPGCQLTVGPDASITSLVGVKGAREEGLATS